MSRAAERPWYMGWSFSKGCPVSQCIPTTSGASRLDRCSLCSQPLKLLWKLIQGSLNLSKANSAPFLALLWNQVKPGGFNWASLWGLVWFPEVKKQNLRCEKQQKLWKALLDSGWDKAREGHKATGSRVTPASPSSSRVAQISDSELSKTSYPKKGGYLGNTTPRERAVWKTMPKKIQLLVYSVSCNHKMACEEETFPNLWFFSNISEQQK